MKLHILCLAVAIMMSSVAGQYIEYVPHTDIEPITSELGDVYDAYRWYQPSIKVLNGCVPFPAVGEYIASRGLKIGGKRNGKCGSSPGQVYARHKDYPEQRVHGIMYAYYFPKDQATVTIGHRHDWEEAVVWVSWDWKSPMGASMSAHGDYTASNEDWNGSHYSVLYANANVKTLFQGINHEFRTNREKDGSYNHPIANWYQLSSAVRYTLNNAVWLDEQGKNSATPKIVDSRFEEYMKKAFDAFF